MTGQPRSGFPPVFHTNQDELFIPLLSDVRVAAPDSSIGWEAIRRHFSRTPATRKDSPQ